MGRTVETHPTQEINMQHVQGWSGMRGSTTRVRSNNGMLAHVTQRVGCLGWWGERHTTGLKMPTGAVNS